jgi:hypothetical protein
MMQLISHWRQWFMGCTKHHQPLEKNIMEVKKQRLTKDQKAAVQQYEHCLRQEDRYLGSVFANAHGQRLIEEKTRQAYENAKRLGVAHLC